MDHIQDIADLVRTVLQSSDFHALLIRGPAGHGKTTAVEAALHQLDKSFVSLSSYSTPLHLFNFLYAHQNDIVVVDDVGGLFQSSIAMSILKAAVGTQQGSRLVSWGSTTAQAEIVEFVFSGKILFICNSFPHGPDAEAVRSRTIPYELSFTAQEASKILSDAARFRDFYSDTELAVAVATFLNSLRTEKNSDSLNLRTLKMGYELARANSADRWKELLAKQICLKPEPHAIVRSLHGSGLTSSQQEIEFVRRTGLKRRTFFKIRRELGLSRRYDPSRG